MADILAVYGTTEGKTRDLIERVARRLEAAGHGVYAGPVEAVSDDDLWTADAVFLAASVHVGQHKPAVVAFARRHLETFARLPSAFLSVSLHAADPATTEAAEGYLEEFLVKTGWRPSLTGLAAGDLRYSRYGFLKRLMMRMIARKNGLSTDVSRDHDFTDYDALHRLVDQFIDIVDQAQEEAAADEHVVG